MSYVHCHGCNWSQDDFWSFKGYNPVRFFFKNELPDFIRPRFIQFDPPPHSYGRIHSWRMLLICAGKWINRLFTQKWWTRKAWREDVKQGKGGCPECGHALCED